MLAIEKIRRGTRHTSMPVTQLVWVNNRNRRGCLHVPKHQYLAKAGIDQQQDLDSNQ